jgi:streptomycin 6-kinase
MADAKRPTFEQISNPAGSVDPFSDPILDDVRQRLTARFGAEIGSWFEKLPAVLGSCRTLARRVGLTHPSREHVGRHPCRMPDGRPAVLKVSPDRARLANEAAALDRWTTVHAPSVLAFDESVGALLIEAIEPGTPLIESLIYPDVETTADLLTSLHANGVPDPSYPPLAHRVAYLFDSGTNPYKRHPELLELIPLELYERGRRLATRLAKSAPSTALLHGDLTPSNILDGGAQRGLVAIDPAPCLGDDLAFEAIDLLLWQADDVDTIAVRAKLLAPAIGADTSHQIEWCTAFAAMTALELAESPDAPADRIQTYMALAAQAPIR